MLERQYPHFGFFLGFLVIYWSDVFAHARFSRRYALNAENIRLERVSSVFRLPKLPKKPTWRRRVFSSLSCVCLWLMLFQREFNFWMTSWLLAILGSFVSSILNTGLPPPTSIFEQRFPVLGIYLHGILPTLLGGGAGVLIMLAIYFLGIFWHGRQKTRTGINKPALGFGDVNLAGIIGLGLDGQVSSRDDFWHPACGVVSILYLRIHYHRLIALSWLPYAPFLILPGFLLFAISFLITFYFGPARKYL